jgi:hypothetical protein
MNWDAIGAIGEIIGALAVVTTLLYLSVQVRQYQRSSIAEGSSKGHELHSAWRNTIVQNTEAAGALAKANSGETLSERDRVQLEFFADELFIASVVSDQFSRHSGTFYDDEAYWRYLVDILRRNPGLIPQWDRIQENVMDLISPEYRAQVNKALAEIRSGTVEADSSTHKVKIGRQG